MFRYWSTLVALLLILPTLACSTLLPPRPEVSWDTQADAMIIQGTYCCGLVPEMVALNYIPDVTVWGDGRVVWTTYDAEQRLVLEGRLTREALRALLQGAVDDGFFGWENSYADYSVTDLASQCLTIRLTSETKTVCEYYQGAPEAFHKLYAQLAGGAGAVGAEYQPARGYLTARRLNNFDAAQTPVTAQWPADADVSLAEAQDGRWVDGAALAAAWQVVNQDRWGALVQAGDAYYALIVQVPGLHQNAPTDK